MIYILWLLSILAVVCWLKFHRRRRIQELTDLIDQLYQKDYQIPMKQDDFSQLEDQIYKLFIELVEEKEKVLHLSQTQSQNLEDIAHQIKTPITGMLFALENDKTDPATFSQQLNRLNDLSNALLKLASLDNNVEGFKLSPVHLSEVMDYALDILSDEIEDREISVDIDLGDKVMLGHFNWLSEAVINILKNAINQDQTTHICLEARENPIYLELSIRDDGGGIAKDKQKKIFQRFYKDPDSNGFGIGLAMAKRIVEKHQGQISCRNTEHGAEFILQFYKWEGNNRGGNFFICFVTDLSFSLAIVKLGGDLMEILRVDNLTKIYGQGEKQVRAVDGVNLSVNRGELIAIVGPSGSGKSTLLHMLGGVDRPNVGKILIEGSDIASYSSKEMALFRRRKVGLIYQFYNLIPNLTVAHNIKLPLKLDGRQVDDAFFNDLVTKLGLSDKLKAFPSELSGGQEQRVAVARSLIYRPSIILADEPTGNLDRKNSQEIIDLLKYFNQTLKQTILIITHDENLALQTQRIITMVDGAIVGDEPNE